MARAQISSPLVKDGNFCSPQAVCPVVCWIEADQADPLIDETTILPSSDVSSTVTTARPKPVATLRSPDRKPSCKCVLRRLGYLEGNRLAGLVLDHHRSCANAVSGEDVAQLQRDQVTAPELAIDRKIEHGEVAHPIGN